MKTKTLGDLMSYVHFTLSERFELFELKYVVKKSLGDIATIMGRAKSTLSRELKRNRVNDNVKRRGEGVRQPVQYLPDTAQAKAETRRREAKRPFESVSEECLAEIRARLERYHSPEQIAGRLKQGGYRVSHETIYGMIYADYRGLGAYKTYLRQARKKRQKRGAKQSGRGRIPNRRGIEERLPEANEKRVLGHWEGDTIIGKGHRGALATYVDKASKFLLAALCPDRRAKSITNATTSLFDSLPLPPKTLTFDNGKEFSKHEDISEALGASCFFANPYHAWERGLNEHTNGLLRQFFPKGTDFTKLTPQELQHAVDLINHRPRKSLAYKTPFEVQFTSTSGSVALQP